MEKIQAYKTVSGKIFETYEEANKYEIGFLERKALEEFGAKHFISGMSIVTATYGLIDNIDELRAIFKDTWEEEE